MLSDKLARLAAQFVAYEGESCELTPAGIDFVVGLLLDYAAEAREIERQVSPAGAPSQPEDFGAAGKVMPLRRARPCAVPPWGWGRGPEDAA